MEEQFLIWSENLSLGEQFIMLTIIAALIGAASGIIIGYFTYLGKANKILDNTNDGGSLSKQHNNLSKEHDNLSKEHDNLSKEHDRIEKDLEKIESKLLDVWKDTYDKNGKAIELAKNQGAVIENLHAAEKILLDFAAEREQKNLEIEKLKSELQQEKETHLRDVAELENCLKECKLRLAKYEKDRAGQER